MTQEFVTLPREVVEQAIDALYCTDSEEGSPAYNFELKAIKELRAALEQPQVEQEICCKIWSVNRIDDLGKIVDSSGRLIATVYGSQADKIVACHNSHANPQPKREPLSTARIDELIEEGIFGGNPYELVRRLEEERGVFMTRPLTVEQIDGIIADLAPVFLDTPTGFEEDFCRAIEAAHDIK